jgi:hypothetical protein
MKLSAVVALLCAPAASGFATFSGSPKASTTSLNGTPQEGMKKVAFSAVAAAFLAGNIVSAGPAVAAVDEMDFGSSQVVAARSGGRAGGRSSAAMRAPSRPVSIPSTNTRVIERTTYVTPSPVIVAPPIYGYGYNPVPGLGMYSNPSCRGFRCSKDGSESLSHFFSRCLSARSPN